MKILKKIFISILIMLIIYINFYSYKVFAFDQYRSDDINAIDDEKYPGIKSMILELKEKNPNWEFKVLYTGLDWKYVIEQEHVHGRNLVPANSIYYDKDWICQECGTKSYDSGNWYCASYYTIEYMMDPRNSLNESDVFQFLQLSYSECTYDELKAMVQNYAYLNKKEIIEGVLRIAKEKNINPFFIMAKIIQEQGNGTSVLATGEKYIGVDGVTYEGYYNLLNIKASGNGKENVITNGLKYAKKMEWTSPEKSIEGGLSTVIVKYIQYGQDTMYFQKFDVSSTRSSHFIYQYMQNVLGAQNEGTILRKSLQTNNLISEKYTFVIPLYENMPQNACPVPVSTYRSSRYGEVSRVNNTTNTENDNEIKTDGNITDTNTKENNNTVDTNVVEGNITNTDKSNETIEEEVTGKDDKIKLLIENKNIKMDEEKKIFVITPEMTVKDLLENTNATEIKNTQDEVIAQTDNIGTGYKIGDYTITVVGDVNGDAEIDIIDLALLKRHISKKQELKDYYEKAGNINQDEEEIDIIDLALLKRHISGKQIISL